MQQTDEYLGREIIWQIASKGAFNSNRDAFETSNVQPVCTNGQALSILSLFTARDRDYPHVKNKIETDLYIIELMYLIKITI